MANQTGTPNRHSRQFGSSGPVTSQVKTHFKADGDRRNGVATSRGAVSPLGGTNEAPLPGKVQGGDVSKQVERAQQPERGWQTHYTGNKGWAG